LLVPASPRWGSGDSASTHLAGRAQALRGWRVAQQAFRAPPGRAAHATAGEQSGSMARPMLLHLPAGTQPSRGGTNMGEIIDKTKGRIKQAVGDLTGDKKLKREGEGDELKGKIERVVKDMKHAIKEAGK
jgi:uncharacterized protein YjbJ (UPF0337 family)